MKQQSDLVQFPLDALCKILNTEKIACLLGYGVSEGVAPHYFDLQCGIAASINAESNKINPFLSQNGYRFFKKWLDWRLACTKANTQSDALRALCTLTQTFNTTTGTQNVDGLHRTLPFESVSELYGCIQDMVSVNTTHGQHDLPDVEMFERNTKDATRAAFLEKISEATLLIAVGTDERLHPFNDPAFKRLKIPRLSLAETQLSFTLKDQAFKLKYPQLQALIRKHPQCLNVEVKDLATAIASVSYIRACHKSQDA